MPPVFPQMHRNAVRAGLFADRRHFHWIWLHVISPHTPMLAIARLAQGGTVVDVNAEENHEEEIDD